MMLTPIAEALADSVPADVDAEVLRGRDNKWNEWAKYLEECLKRKGYYINKAKGDPSGRW